MDKIDVYVVVIVLCAGFFQSRYLKGFALSKDSSYDSALKTLGLSAIASTVYIVLAKDPAHATNWAKYFISYFAATSLYELIISKFVDWVKEKTGVDIKEKKP
jgi:predicted neutral ceramidase superfamily lipid hydrolase